MKLSIVILTWNSEKHVENCLDSIMNSVDLSDAEIIIVDNGSTDKTIDIISKQFPFVYLIRNAKNRGVAPARNQGIRAASGEFILILDIDTRVHDKAINILLEHLETHPDIGLCGPRLCFEDGTMQNSFRRFPLVHTKILRRINTKWAEELLKNEYYMPRAQLPYEVDYVIGACQLIRRRAIDEAGLLDDKIFYGPEDVDLCLRLWLKGWKVCYLPDAVITHYEQRITKSRVFSYTSFKHIQGLIYYFFKHKYLFSRKSLYRKISSNSISISDNLQK